MKTLPHFSAVNTQTHTLQAHCVLCVGGDVCVGGGGVRQRATQFERLVMFLLSVCVLNGTYPHYKKV